MRRIAGVLALASLVWVGAVASLARAETAFPPTAPTVAGPVDCATFARPVVAYDIAKGQSAADVQPFLSDLASDGFSTGTVSGTLPACVDVLVILDASGAVGLQTPYTSAEAASIKTWVDAGHALMLFGEWGSFRAGTEALFVAFGYSQGGPNALTDPNDFDPLGGTDWVIYQSDNFASHPVLEGVATIEFLRSAWLSPTTSAIVTSDANSNPPSVPVMAVVNSGAGCAALSSDSNWVTTAAPTSNAGYFKRDNATLARQVVSWLDSCGQGPVARPGGPYTVNEGSSVTLNASASTDPNGDPLSFAWDLDDDGLFDDAFVVNPIFSAALLDDGSYPVAVVASDGVYSDTGHTTIAVLNVPPSVALTATHASAGVGTPITFFGSISDPGALDTHTPQWNFGDGTPSLFGLLTRSHTFNTSGTYNVVLTVTDDNGGVGQAARVVQINTSQSNPSRVMLPLVARNLCTSQAQYADVALVMDTSGSMGEQAGGQTKLDRAKSAASQFVNLLALPGDQAAVVSFDDVATLDHVLSDDRPALLAALNALQAGGVTRMDLGLAVARGELTSVRHKPDNARALIFLTDGQPNGTTEQAVLDQAGAVKASGIELFTIGLGSSVSADFLRQVATSPDHYYPSPTAADLTAIYERIADTLRCP